MRNSRVISGRSGQEAVVLIAIVAAVLAGASFAAGGVLQQRVARSRPQGESLSLRLLADLVRRRTWLAGIGLAFLSYGFQALALAFGPLALVQPLIVTELVWALPISTRLHGLRLGVREWTGAAMVTGGLALAIASAHPEPGRSQPALARWIAVLAVAAAAGGAGLLVARRLRGPLRASLLAFTAGTVFAVQSGLFKSTIHRLDTDLPGTFLAWQTYLLIAASIAGLLLIQSAFQAGPLASSMPVVDATEPLAAIAIGIFLFGETVAVAPLRIALALAGLAAMLGGIVVLDSSAVVQRLYQREEERRDTEVADRTEQPLTA